jgi:hypothetical protein
MISPRGETAEPTTFTGEQNPSTSATP